MLSKCAGWYLQVYTLVWVVANKLLTLYVLSSWIKVFATGESGTVVPLPTSNASAPWRSSHAGRGRYSYFFPAFFVWHFGTFSSEDF